MIFMCVCLISSCWCCSWIVIINVGPGSTLQVTNHILLWCHTFVMWERNNINVRFLWGSLPRPMSSHMCSACVCVCVCMREKAAVPMGTAASSVSPTSFSLIPTSKFSNAVDSVCHCHALKASSAYEAWVWLEWRSPQQNRDYCWPGGHCSAVLL